MGYVRTAGMSTAARRRRRRTALVLTVLLLLLAGVLVFAITQFRESTDSPSADNGDATTGPTEQVTQAPPEMDPAEISVNVYNATGRQGLAGSTADALATYGYTIAGFDNDPLGATVEVVDIRHGAEGADAAAYLQQELFPNAQLVPDEREDDSVDLVLGDGFETLDPAGTGE